MTPFIKNLFDKAYRQREQRKLAEAARPALTAQEDARIINASQGETINRELLGRVLAEKEKQKGR